MNNSEEEIASSLRNVLDKHGHSFHYALMRKADEMAIARQTEWRLYGTEIPVKVNGQVIHIDFVLKHKTAEVYLIAECKRAEPAKANWCFVKAPFTFPDGYSKDTYVDVVKKERTSSHVQYGCAVAYTDRGIFQIGHELKTG
ncbi:MAG: hypothetical protein ABWZ66_06540, partial [Pyrinomonadaceae bacterium]